ncbi:MAG: hypothetical protein ACKPKO_14150, partial [Candidatus Fonsibacter sp.]
MSASTGQPATAKTTPLATLNLGRLATIFTAALASDCLDQLGVKNQVLKKDIEMISGEGVMLGFAFPVRMEIVDTA